MTPGGHPVVVDGERRYDVQKLLVVAEVALAVLLIPAGLFVRSLQAAHAIDTGFDAEKLVSAPLDLIHSALSFSIARRSREMGIRLALGAASRQVFLLVVRDGMTLVGVGAVLGLLGGLAAARSLARFLYGVPTSDLPRSPAQRRS